MMMLRRILSLVLVFLFVFPFAAFGASAEAGKTVYLSPGGSDGGTGDVSSPFATIEKAVSALPTGGTIVVTGAISGVWFESSMKDTPHTGTITVTGKGYPKASLIYKSPVLYGDFVFEDMTLKSAENYCFFNPIGHTLTMGRGVVTEGAAYIHVGSNTAEKAPCVASSAMTLDEGKFNNVYLGGCYCESTDDGIEGDLTFRMNGGSIDRLTVGFDSYLASHTNGRIGGNVLIDLAGGNVGSIDLAKLDDKTGIGGTLTVLIHGGTAGNMTLPQAAGGTYAFRISGKGDVVPTGKNGVYTFTKENDESHILLDGEEIAAGEHDIKPGEHIVRIVRDITEGGDLPMGEKIISGGTFGTICTDEAYGGDASDGIGGDASLILNNVKVDWLCVGFKDGVGTINGNVSVEINDMSDVERVAFRNLADNTVHGALSIIYNNSFTNFTAYPPYTDNGYFVITAIGNGKVHATDDVGVFALEPEQGYCAEVNGEIVDGDTVTFPAGAHLVTFVRKESALPAVGDAYINGYPDGSFRPDGLISRAEAISLLAAIAGWREDDGGLKADFSDVGENDWYRGRAAFLQSKNALPAAWRPGGALEASKPITRVEFAEMVYALCGGTVAAYKLVGFPDLPDGDGGAAVAMLAGAGVITGYPDGTFGPDRTLTRAEAVTIVNRTLSRAPAGDTGETAFSDIGGHWAEKEILAAAKGDPAPREEASFTLPEGNFKDYITSLYDAAPTLSGEAIEEAQERITEKMRQDVVSSPDTLVITGTTYYVSNDGNDDNDGKSPEKAWKTLSKVSNTGLHSGDGVLFRRGDLFRGTLRVQTGVSYGAYGEGNKPLLVQSARNYAVKSLWKETDYPNVYVCTLNINNVGIIAFDHDVNDYTEKSCHETVGIMKNKGVMGFRGIEDLHNDLEFYSDLSANKLYLYSDKGNPGERFKDIEMGTREDVISGAAWNVTIDNLSVKFTGAHGMGGAGGTHDRVVQNCIFSWLGGSILSDNYLSLGPVNYGNAVEIYGGCNGFRVENCWIYQIYDTAVTHQYSSGDACTQENVRYIGNLMEYVHWGIEFYNQGSSPIDSTTKYTRDVLSAYNVLRYGGYGWGSIQRYRQCAARPYCGWLGVCANYDWLTEYNLFYKSTGFLVHTVPGETEVQRKNLYLQTEGGILGVYRGAFVRADEEALKNLKVYDDDTDSVVVLVK